MPIDTRYGTEYDVLKLQGISTNSTGNIITLQGISVVVPGNSSVMEGISISTEAFVNLQGSSVMLPFVPNITGISLAIPKRIQYGFNQCKFLVETNINIAFDSCGNVFNDVGINKTGDFY